MHIYIHFLLFQYPPHPLLIWCYPIDNHLYAFWKKKKTDESSWLAITSVSILMQVYLSRILFHVFNARLEIKLCSKLTNTSVAFCRVILILLCSFIQLVGILVVIRQYNTIMENVKSKERLVLIGWDTFPLHNKTCSKLTLEENPKRRYTNQLSFHVLFCLLLYRNSLFWYPESIVSKWIQLTKIRKISRNFEQLEAVEPLKRK